MRYITMLFPLAYLFLACASATLINSVPGEQAYLIECPGSANSMSKCVAKANELCPRGYSIEGASETPTGSTSVIIDPNLGTASAIQGVDRRLVVRCK